LVVLHQRLPLMTGYVEVHQWYVEEEQQLASRIHEKQKPWMDEDDWDDALAEFLELE